MKLHSQAWVKMESVGKPQFTKIFHGSIREIAMAIAGWLSEVHMGSHIRIRLARTQAELEDSTRNADQKALAAELDAMLGGTPEGDDESDMGVCQHGESAMDCGVCRIEESV